MRVLVATELDTEDYARLTKGFPKIEFVQAGDGAQAIDRIAGCEVMFGSRVSPELLSRADTLRWIHTRSAGVNSLPFDDLVARGITVTNSSGAHGVPIAENFLALMLAFAVGLHILIPAQRGCRWDPEPARKARFELEGQTLLIVGLGDLGAALALKAKGLGMYVLGIRRTNQPPPKGVDEQLSFDAQREALKRADHVALCLPLTPATVGFISEPELRAMKPSAFIYNAGRGRSIERVALIRALTEGWIAGAGLDVTDPEPLPPDDPLWLMPNVILTQHTSGSSPANSRRVTDLIMENLRRHLAGEPLMNVIDLREQY
jgi:phosphoglycerate dehydrogenase-like enzyme